MVFFHRFAELKRIMGSDLPRGLRLQIARDAMRLSIRSRKRLANPISLVGFQVSYFNPHELSYLFSEIFVNMSYFFRTESETPIILDCGSNIGMSILFFKKIYPKARIIAFEPDPATFEKLHANVEQNLLTNTELHQCALGSTDGMVDLFQGARDGSLVMSLLSERGAGAKIEVPSRRLSSFITEEVDLLKIDIEGAEEIVLNEVAESGKLRLVRQLHLEYHHHINPATDRFSFILKLLEDNGFGYRLAAPTQHFGLATAHIFQDIALYGYRK